MLDALLDRLFLIVLVLPIVGALGAGVLKWWREARGQRPSVSGEVDGAEVGEMELVREEGHYRLRGRNKGATPARDVHVYLNNKPISRHRGGASAEQHPIPELGPDESFSYRYVPGRGEPPNRVAVRIEWDDGTGGGVTETTVPVP